jgi:hypothetical protein
MTKYRAIKVLAMLIIILLSAGQYTPIFAQSEEVNYQDAPSGINEDNDDRMRRAQEEESRNQSHYYSAPSVGGPSNDDNANPPDPGGDPGAPIDGGLSLLLAAGAGYGIKRSRNKMKAKI